MTTDIQSVILQQLSEIQRSLGETIGVVNALREEVKTQGTESSDYRDDVQGKLTNAVNRVGELERDMKAIRTTLEKTIAPLILNEQNMRQRVIGFLSAWGIFITVIGGLTWLVFGGGLGTIAKFLVKNAAP